MKLPSLREELVIQEGPRTHDGQPSWTLQDPARNRFFRLDWLTFEIFRHWSLGDPEAIARSINDQTPLRPDPEAVMAVLTFAGRNQLLSFAGADNSASLADVGKRARPSWWQWLVHNYLFFRIPLIRPEPLLQWLHCHLGLAFQRAFWNCSALAAGIGFALIWRQWDGFKATWLDYTDLNGLFGYFLVLVMVKVLHEFGHGLAATHFGCRVPSMGIAFLVLTPVAYTDTNEAWSLRDRKSRLWIGAAGMLTEVALAAWATLAWGLLPEGYLRSVAFMVATTMWVKSILINTSPIMRFDGYYLLSDWLDLPNLHSRCFALARWQLREWLFGIGETPPEYFRKPLRRGLVALAVFIWGYRLVVFTSIAIFVYQFFFKALGIVLFAVEIGWFVALPILSELKVWWEKRETLRRSPRRGWVVSAVLLAIVVACLPIPQRIRVMGQLFSDQEFKISAPESAQLRQLGVRDGERVHAGQTLLALDSDLLRFRLAKAKAREDTLAAELAASEANPALKGRLPVMQGELDRARAVRRETETSLQLLGPRAPFEGTFHVADCDLRPGDWISRQEVLGTVVPDNHWSVVVYINEQYSHLVAVGSEASLHLDGVPGRPVRLTVASIEADASRLLAYPMLTTQFGGAVQARLIDGELVPDRAVYRVNLAAENLPSDLSTQVRRGEVVIKAGAESAASRWSRAVLSVLWREAGF